MYTLLGTARPHLREITTLLEWIYSFLAYAAVRSSDPVARNLLTYARLILCEACRHSGSRWLEYDKVFRQLAAMDPTLLWNELSASLLALTVLSLQGNQGLFLLLVPESRPHRVTLLTLPLCPTIPGAIARRTVRPKTLEHICISWNKGQCAFLGLCTFKHVCATCHRRGHRAWECEETPDSSSYKMKAAPLVAG